MYDTRTSPTVRREVWTTTVKERVSCMVLCNARRLGVDAAAVAKAAAAVAAGGAGPRDRRASVATEAPEGELLLVGTQDGDVWFVQAEKQGQMVRQLPSHRNVSIKHILVRIPARPSPVCQLMGESSHRLHIQPSPKHRVSEAARLLCVVVSGNNVPRALGALPVWFLRVVRDDR